jgi:CRP/FNR family cyclic AMP-dependent transcriptional regulator
MDVRGLFSGEQDVQEFAPGTTVFEQGAPGDVMYVVLDGELELRAGDTVLEVAVPGEIVGEMALIDAQPRSATAVARSHCRLAVVGEKRFLFLVQQTPFFALHVMGILADRLRQRTTPAG